MKTTKSRYYEALDRQGHAERILRGQLQADRQRLLEDDSSADTADFPLHADEDLCFELGSKLLAAIMGGLDWLSQGPSSPAGAAGQSFHAIVEPLVREFRSLQQRMDTWDSRFSAIEAGLRRVDRFTLDALHEMEDLRRSAAASASLAAPAGRLPKEETARLALEAARLMKQEGKRLTLASVARRAGLKYGQIVYAFGNKEGFEEALTQASFNQTTERTVEQAVESVAVSRTETAEVAEEAGGHEAVRGGFGGRTDLPTDSGRTEAAV